MSRVSPATSAARRQNAATARAARARPHAAASTTGAGPVVPVTAPGAPASTPVQGTDARPQVGAAAMTPARRRRILAAAESLFSRL